MIRLFLQDILTPFRWLRESSSVLWYSIGVKLLPLVTFLVMMYGVVRWVQWWNDHPTVFPTWYMVVGLAGLITTYLLFLIPMLEVSCGDPPPRICISWGILWGLITLAIVVPVLMTVYAG